MFSGSCWPLCELCACPETFGKSFFSDVLVLTHFLTLPETNTALKDLKVKGWKIKSPFGIAYFHGLS